MISFDIKYFFFVNDLKVAGSPAGARDPVWGAFSVFLYGSERGTVHQNSAFGLDV
jgi:hypothetical protein